MSPAAGVASQARPAPPRAAIEGAMAAGAEEFLVNDSRSKRPARRSPRSRASGTLSEEPGRLEVMVAAGS